MPYNIEDKFVIAVASSALFDLRLSGAVFTEQGEMNIENISINMRMMCWVKV
ncbi:hypothetical protein JCM16418_575 [Paenibacillus pini JCM 16418]|uniref:5'-nucleotidase n=1 Tax=Paenibacillus pini JCM 16418 TaxID=1236976 RepID=W7YPY6_9BACL|nr:hypothetical protein JCM16418_575 [Paenibacillus pini JCM 16418]